MLVHVPIMFFMHILVTIFKNDYMPYDAVFYIVIRYNAITRLKNNCDDRRTF